MCPKVVKWCGLIVAAIVAAGFSTTTAQRAEIDVVRQRQQDMKAMAAALHHRRVLGRREHSSNEPTAPVH